MDHLNSVAHTHKLHKILVFLLCILMMPAHVVITVAANPRLYLLCGVLPIMIEGALTMCLDCPKTHRDNSEGAAPSFSKTGS